MLKFGNIEGSQNVNIMGVNEYLGKFNYRCEMCHRIEYSDTYKWIGDITKQELKICAKCARREGGKKWPEKSQQLKNLKQK